VVCPVASSGVVKSGHGEGLCHVTEGFFHTLVSNLDCTPEDASANPGGKGKELRLFLNSGLFAKPRVDSTLAGVGGPIALTSSSPGIIHRCSSNRCPRSVEITFNQRAEGGCTLPWLLLR
jgi:hypothetical protein